MILTLAQLYSSVPASCNIMTVCQLVHNQTLSLEQLKKMKLDHVIILTVTHYTAHLQTIYVYI